MVNNVIISPYLAPALLTSLTVASLVVQCNIGESIPKQAQALIILTDCLTVFLLIMDRCENANTNCGNQPDDEFEHSYLGGGICQYTYRHNTNYRIRYETNT